MITLASKLRNTIKIARIGLHMTDYGKWTHLVLSRARVDLQLTWLRSRWKDAEGSTKSMTVASGRLW